MRRTTTAALLLLLTLLACTDHATQEEADLPSLDSVSDRDSTPGPTAPDASTTPDLTADDATPDTIPDTLPDTVPDLIVDVDTTDPDGFCQGASKLALNGTSVPVPVTSTKLIMDCCEGFSLHFHTEALPSTPMANVVTLVRAMGAQVPNGTFDLQALPELLEISRCTVDPFVCELLPMDNASGWLRIENTAYSEPTFATLCLLGAQTSAGTLSLYSGVVPVAPYDWDSRFEIHLLADPALTALDVQSTPLAELVLNEFAVLSLMGVDSYDEANQIVGLDGWSGSLASRIPAPGVFGRPFVLLADGQRIYLGAFMTASSSWAASVPTIFLDAIVDGRMPIVAARVGAADPRFDVRIHAVMAEAGKLVVW